MSKVMLYSHPRTVKGDDEKKGSCKVGKEEFDYIIVDTEEVEACLEEGFYETPGEALKGGSDEDLEDEDLEDEDLEDEDLEDEDLEDVKGGSDVETTTQEVTLSLSDLEGKTADEIKEAYIVEELQVLAKACDIKRATRMNEDTLVEKLLAKLGE